MIIDIIENKFNTVFAECGFEETAKIIKSNRPDLCDYQCDNAFALAKKYHKSPIEIGDLVVKKLNTIKNFNEYFKDITFVKPGFININISNHLINSALTEMFNNENFNIKKTNKKQLFFLDYGGPNVAKPLHVGHMRTAILGESIKRIIEFMGYKTISDVHLGDYGLQIGQVIYGFLEDKKNIDEINIEYLDYIYPKMSKICKENKEILEKCANITKELQEGNLEYQRIWKKICEISIGDIKKIYNYLGVHFDLWNGESDAYKYIANVTILLNKHNLLENSEGAKIVRVSKETDSKEIPPLIYEKSNGAYLYGTTDLAAIYERINKYKANNILYVVDLRQKLHFEQVFRTCELLGISNNTNLEYLGYGTVNGSDGKPFKTRSGDTIKLNELFKQAKEVFIATKESNKDLKEEDLDIIVNAIIKFADFQNNREKDYIFDILKFSNVVGKTGPYILYTYLRINKILKEENFNINSLNDEIINDFDRNLRLKLSEMPIALNNAFEERMPHYIAEYLYDLCVLINIFYQNNQVKKTDDNIKSQWLLVLTLANKITKELLSLLLIKIPSEM